MILLPQLYTGANRFESGEQWLARVAAVEVAQQRLPNSALLTATDTFTCEACVSVWLCVSSGT